MQKYRGQHDEQLRTLRRKFQRWADDNIEHLGKTIPAIPDEIAHDDRAADNWEPLLELADQAGGPWPKMAREAALTIHGKPVENTLEIELLSDIKRCSTTMS